MQQLVIFFRLKFNFIKIYFIANFTPLKLLFDFSIKSEIEFLQKWNYNIYNLFGTTSLYRMTPNVVSNKKKIIYLANHRTFSDFTIDSIVVYNTASFIGRYMIAIALPGSIILKLMSRYVEYFVRRQGKTDITAFEKMLNGPWCNWQHVGFWYRRV